MGGPKRDYSWKTFEPGNTAALKSGVHSERSIERVMAEHSPELLAAAPWIADAAFRDALMRYLRAEARARLADREVKRIANEDGPSKVPPYLWGVAASADRLAAQLAARLGLDPAGKTALLRDASMARHFAPDLAAMWAAEDEEDNDDDAA